MEIQDTASKVIIYWARSFYLRLRLPTRTEMSGPPLPLCTLCSGSGRKLCTAVKKEARFSRLGIRPIRFIDLASFHARHAAACV